MVPQKSYIKVVLYFAFGRFFWPKIPMYEKKNATSFEGTKPVILEYQEGQLKRGWYLII